MATYLDADIERIEYATVAEVKSNLILKQLGFATTENIMVRKNADGTFTEFPADAPEDTTKADKIVPSSAGNIAGLDASGNLLDKGFKLNKNTDFGLISYVADDGCELKITYDDVIPFYNDTGATLTAGTVVHLVGGAMVGSQVMATFEKANASDWEKVQGTIGFTTCDVENSTKGFVGVKGQYKHIDTSHVTAATQLWVSATTAGAFTDIKPTFPDYAISLGGSVNSAEDGEVLANITSSYNDTFHDAWDGAIRESFDFRVTSNGSVVTGTLKNVTVTRNLTLLLSSGFHTLDTTSADLTIALTAGTDELTVTNYVYIPIATKALTVSTSGFPTTEHCKIARCEVQSASSVLADGGARRNQNINDHIKSENNNGHVLHIAERVRQLSAKWDNGTESTLTGTTANGYIQMTGGQVWQMHKQTVPTFSMPTDNILVTNDDTTAYKPISKLTDITEYSDGSTWNNSWSNIVVWGVANKTGEPSFVFCNLPSDGYNTESNAIADRNNYTDYTIPSKYNGVGFLVARFTVRMSGGSITYSSSTGYKDLRGFIPNNIAGGGGGGGGVTSYLGLDDTPSTYSGQAGKIPTVNSTETGLEFSNGIARYIVKNEEELKSALAVTGYYLKDITIESDGGVGGFSPTKLSGTVTLNSHVFLRGTFLILDTLTLNGTWTLSCLCETQLKDGLTVTSGNVKLREASYVSGVLSGTITYENGNLPSPAVRGYWDNTLAINGTTTNAQTTETALENYNAGLAESKTLMSFGGVKKQIETTIREIRGACARISNPKDGFASLGRSSDFTPNRPYLRIGLPLNFVKANDKVLMMSFSIDLRQLQASHANVGAGLTTINVMGYILHSEASGWIYPTASLLGKGKQPTTAGYTIYFCLENDKPVMYIISTTAHFNYLTANVRDFVVDSTDYADDSWLDSWTFGLAENVTTPNIYQTITFGD